MAGLRQLGDFDATSLMKSWMKIVDDDNRSGILLGLDAQGVMMTPVTYRPVAPPKKPAASQKMGKRANVKKGEYQGFGPLASGLHGNLTSAEYRLLGGPPLAPRGQFSRVITNFQTDYARLRPGYWQVTFWWENVVSNEGRSFLRYHFTGGKHLPRRDLRGIRPTGLARCAEALQAFASDLLRQAFGRGRG